MRYGLSGRNNIAAIESALMYGYLIAAFLYNRFQGNRCDMVYLGMINNMKWIFENT